MHDLKRKYHEHPTKLTIEKEDTEVTNHLNKSEDKQSKNE